jgi:hypothetical protein
MQFDTIAMLFGDIISYNNMMRFPKKTDIEVSWEIDEKRDEIWFSIGHYYSQTVKGTEICDSDYAYFADGLNMYVEEHKEPTCECCESGLPATKINGIYCCVRCDNFECELCGTENDKTGGLINWNERLQMCLCDYCIPEEDEEEIQTRVCVIDGQEYLIDAEYTVYAREPPYCTIGRYNTETGKIDV